MPSISEFYGIKIYIYWNDNQHHHTPHFHAFYAEYEGVFKLNGDLIVGNVPNTAKRLIKLWAMENLLKINYAWNMALKKQMLPKIDGLK